MKETEELYNSVFKKSGLFDIICLYHLICLHCLISLFVIYMNACV